MGADHELITAQALAEALGLSVETIWRYTREQRIPYVQLGSRQYRYRLHDVINALSAPQVREKSGEYAADPARRLTYQDYLQLPEEPGVSFEILDGVLIREPSPSVIHQRVSRRLQRILEDYVAAVDPAGEVFDSPLDVTLGDYTVVQPDLLYVAGAQGQQVLPDRIDGPPTLVVEILSPSTVRKDRVAKMRVYQRAQIANYWLVYPEEKSMECFALRDGIYALVASGLDDEIVRPPDFPELMIELAKLWREPGAY